jgi:hypothetical protein
MIFKEDIVKILKEAKEVFPICIPSFNRFTPEKNKTIENVIKNCDKNIKENTYVFVRENQYDDYVKAFGNYGINIVKLPFAENGVRTRLVETREAMSDYVYNVLKKPYMIDVDDDITSLKYVYFDESDGKTKLSLKDEGNNSEIIRLGCQIAKYAFEEEKCVLGNFRRVRFANNLEYSQNCLLINAGATPRQFSFVNSKYMHENNIKRDICFNSTGDDIGFVAEIAKNKLNMFNICCLTYSYVDDAINSVIRNDDNRKELASYEFKCLKQYPIKYYLRVPFTYEDGSYKFSDIDFGKYVKYNNLISKKVPLVIFKGPDIIK